MSKGRARGNSFHEDENDLITTTTLRAHEHTTDHNNVNINEIIINDSTSNEENEPTAEEEEEIYSRGRSRSKSVIGSDTTPPIPITENNDGNSSSENCSNTSMNDKKERTGPLLQREVLALRKGLEQATNSRNKEQILEEEQEKKDAETEKMLRVNAANLPPTVVSDTMTKKVKVLLLGDSGVGKSSLLLRWTMDTFNPTLVGTIGINFKTKRIQLQGEAIQVQVWDTAGQEQFHKITTSYYRGAHAIILIFDVTDEKTLFNVEYWIKNIKSHASEAVHVTLVGNKTDLRKPDMPHSVDSKKGHDVAHSLGVPYFETSAKDSFNVNEAFVSTVRSTLAETSPTASVDPKNPGDKKKGLFNKIFKDKSKLEISAEEKEKCVIA